MNDIWDFFGSIHCININNRTDRYVSSKNVFDTYNIPVKYFFVKRHKNGDRGCFNSHVEICKQNLNQKNIIIFEDDISPTKNFSIKNIKYIISCLKKIKNWDIFYLGCFPNNYYNTLSTKYTGIYKTRSVGAHAYIINNHYIHKIASLKWDQKPYDSYLTNNYHYCYLPTLFTQNTLDSNIERGINIVNKFPFIKRLCLGINEYYAIYIGINIRILVFIVLVIIIIIKRINNRNT